MVKTVLVIVAALVAAVLVFAAFRPDSFRLSRSTTVNAAPDKVFSLLNDLRRFNEWNPFAQLDPHNAITYDAVTAGVGGAYRWQGDKSGAGRMQITESLPPQRVTAALDFNRPFEAHNRVDFTVEAQGDDDLLLALAPYRGAKGNLSFPLAEDLPLPLIRRVARQRVSENAAKARARKAR
jgi:uncharacterized protein YndB with AHSA1/START domain